MVYKMMFLTCPNNNYQQALKGYSEFMKNTKQLEKVEIEEYITEYRLPKVNYSSNPYSLMVLRDPSPSMI